MVTIQLGPTLVVDDIKEGDDVYFECHVRANPDWKRLQWFHNVSTITQLLHAGGGGRLQKLGSYGKGRFRCASKRNLFSIDQSADCVPLASQVEGRMGGRLLRPTMLGTFELFNMISSTIWLACVCVCVRE